MSEKKCLEIRTQLKSDGALEVNVSECSIRSLLSTAEMLVKQAQEMLEADELAETETGAETLRTFSIYLEDLVDDLERLDTWWERSEEPLEFFTRCKEYKTEGTKSGTETKQD